jgi:hypothetical protein
LTAKTVLFDQLFAFVLMPFAPEFKDVYEVGIKDAAGALGIRVERLDDQLFDKNMLERIFEQIDKADIIVAEMTSRNPNVFYEVGYAHAKGKLVLLITADAADIPFDLQQRKHIVYGGSVSYLRQELEKHLAWARDEVSSRKVHSPRVTIAVSETDLTVTEYTANASIKIAIDVHNDGEQRVDITSMYLYSERKWRVKQDNVESPMTSSDRSPYQHRYHLRLPVTQLQKDAWLPVTCTAESTIASKWKGQEVKASYESPVSFMVRLDGSLGTFEYRFDKVVDFVEIPF